MEGKGDCVPNKQYRLTLEEYELIRLLRFKQIQPEQLIKKLSEKEEKEEKPGIVKWNFPK